MSLWLCSVLFKSPFTETACAWCKLACYLLDSILSSVTHYFLQFNSVLIIIDLVLVLVFGLKRMVLVLGLDGQVLVNITDGNGMIYLTTGCTVQPNILEPIHVDICNCTRSVMSSRCTSYRLKWCSPRSYLRVWWRLVQPHYNAHCSLSQPSVSQSVDCMQHYTARDTIFLSISGFLKSFVLDLEGMRVTDGKTERHDAMCNRGS